MRTIAILGRPNVGKSSLFNRLVGTRRALVHDMPGVTRDRLEGVMRLGEQEIRLIDTAGLEAGEEESLPGRLRQQTMAGLEEADLGVLLIDARTGLTALDHEIAAWLRRSSKPILVVANKAESRAAISGVAEAWELGLGEPIAVSAEHGEGIGDLKDILLANLPGEEREGPEAEEVPEDWIRLAVVGRPNVGKSSLINRLLESERLLTGPEPGLTRDSVTVAWEWEGRRVELVDTAGLRRRSRIEAPVEKLAASASIRAIKACHVVLLMIDATAPLEHQDMTIANLAIEEGRGLVIAANKWDLVDEPSAALEEIRHLVGERLAQVKGLPVVPISARTGRGMEKLLPAVVQAFERWQKRVPTPALNRWLKEALDRHAPPLVQRRRLKIRYMTQASTRPPTFILFANKPAESMPDSYLRYLSGSLRDVFDLKGVPLRFRVRHGENPYD